MIPNEVLVKSIPNIVQEFKDGLSMRELAIKYSTNTPTIEACIRLVFILDKCFVST